jgi:hypothetical protein
MAPEDRRSVRLPLSVGVSSLGALVMGVLLLPAGLAGLVVVGALAWWIGDLSDLTLYALALTGSTALSGAWALRSAWKQRPSDVIFDANGMRVEGGARHGWTIAWDAVDPERTRIVEQRTAGSKGSVVGSKLHIATKGTKEPTLIAAAAVQSDMDSLVEIHAIILDRTRPPAEATLDGAPGALRCTGCGATAAPVDALEVTCRHCATAIAIPANVRERVRASKALDRAEQRAAKLVARLLDQPGARSTAVALGVAFLFIGGAWPVAAGLGVHLYRAHTLTVATGAALFVLPFLLIADGFFLSRVRFVDRHALATLTIGFGAHPPAKEGDPLACRACGGPLPDAGEAVCVRCVFCSAMNLTTVDVVGCASRAKGTVKTLDHALDDRQRERARWRARAIASLPLLLMTAALLRLLW